LVKTLAAYDFHLQICIVIFLFCFRPIELLLKNICRCLYCKFTIERCSNEGIRMDFLKTIIGACKNAILLAHEMYIQKDLNNCKYRMYKITIIPKENLDSILPLLELLNPKTAKEVLAQRLQEIKGSSYECVGVYSGARLIGISGIWILNKIYAGKHIEPDNVIIHPDFRSRGIGEILMNWLHEYGINNGCLTSELNSRVGNEDGNRFWKSQGYEIVGFHFIKRLGRYGNDANSLNSCLGGHN
jgi:GNAT superfamily N-acetyltransferase